MRHLCFSWYVCPWAVGHTHQAMPPCLYYNYYMYSISDTCILNGCVDVWCICQMFMGRSLTIKYLGWRELVWLQCWGTSGQFCQGLSRSGWSASVINYIINVSFKAQHYRTNNIIITMGGDFAYENSIVDYKNLDKLMYYVNKVKVLQLWSLEYHYCMSCHCIPLIMLLVNPVHLCAACDSN